MNAAAKIRWLLALICVSLFLTAIIARNTYSARSNLESSCKTLEAHLHNKEEIVHDLIGEKNSFDRLKNIANDENIALNVVELTKKERIYVSVFNGTQLIFWSGIRAIPTNISGLKDGSSFRQEPNGLYEVIKKSEGAFSAVVLIPVKNAYAYQNSYLKNIFSPDLLQDDNIEIADFTDQNVYNVHSIDHIYLFSLRLKPNDLNHFFVYVQILLWLSGMLLLCALTNNLAGNLAKKGFVLSAIAIVGAFIVIIRAINLYGHWPDIFNELEIFNPSVYQSGTLFPSLGDFVVNIALIVWFSAFVYSHRQQLSKPVQGKTQSYLILVLSVLFLIVYSTVLLNLFSGLVFKSKINFDVNNVLNLSGFSIVGVFMLCFAYLAFLLFVETFLSVCEKLNISKVRQLVVFLFLILLASLVEVLRHDYSCFYLLWSLLVIIRGYAVFYDKARFSPLTYIGIIIIYASISSVKLYIFQSVKEKETRKELVKRLETSDDPTAQAMFVNIENRLTTDPLLLSYFTDHNLNHNYLKINLQKVYFDGYLSKYDVKTYAYNFNAKSLSTANLNDLNDFKFQVQLGAFQVAGTRYFYKASNSFGFQNYFAIVPIGTTTEPLGTLVIELKSKPLKSTEPFPELLLENKVRDNDDYKGYSYAFYSDGKLLNQSGKYIYSLANFEFEGKLKQFVYKVTNSNGTDAQGPAYSHLIYQPSDRKLIVVSKEEDKVYSGITSITFFFLVFLSFTLLVLGAILVWQKNQVITSLKIFKWNFWNNFDKVLYKTRIQLSMVFAVVVTLLIIGILTFLSVRNQYLNQQDDQIRDKISHIEVAFEKGIADKDLVIANEETQFNFNAFADAYSADLTLFDTTGKKQLTTQPKLYEAGLIAPRMNARAFVYLNRLKKSGFINEEVIGGLNYKAAYAPVHSSKNNNLVVGYLQLPYFSNETEYKERIGAFLNTMINVYALVFIAIGLFAIVVARQITTPLTLIQQSLSKTIYGRKNEPIQWHHNDEIGSLIKEYNNMIAALENSAQKLAQSERENAWREMAKQVAHEIKNPLTPLKLGLQLLEKAWKDKDPKFDAKFERFSASFVEQIDSLSKIASEFSNFAKMPETKLERFNVFDIINQAITIFKQTDNFEIIYTQSPVPFYIMADKDQILRCFNNLLKNAIEAVPNDRMGILEISYDFNSRGILLKIKDNGNGIPEALRERIFVPNFTTKSSGTGLGLALVKNAIEYSGGTISFETVLNEGTTFFISFPAAS